MAYIFKQKFDLRHLVDLKEKMHKVFVIEPESYLLNLYHSYLTNHNFEVELFNGLDSLEKGLLTFRPNLIIVNAYFFTKDENLKTILTNLQLQSLHFPIISIGNNLTNEDLKNIMSLGVVSHIDRRFSRPQDIIFLAKSILQHK